VNDTCGNRWRDLGRIAEVPIGRGMMKIGNLFLLSWKKALLIFGALVVSLILHGLVYGLFKSYFDRHGGDEPFFFLIVVIVIPLYVLISLAYTIIYYWKRKKT